MFPLCSACPDTMNQGNCTHSDEERFIFGTWVVGENSKVVEKEFYKLLTCPCTEVTNLIFPNEDVAWA